MLSGDFVGASGLPRIFSELWIPRFNLRHVIPFCIDAGATYSMLMPSDALSMGVDYRLLSDEVDLATAGEATAAFVEPAELTFHDRDAGKAYAYLVMLTIAPLPIDVSGLPSLLGRDIINRWRIDYHPTAQQLACEVITADETIHLDGS